MAEYDTDQSNQTEGAVRPKRRVDFFTLFAGVVALLVAGYVLGDGASWLPVMDLRWVLAGGAVIIGVLMLIASVAGGRRSR